MVLDQVFGLEGETRGWNDDAPIRGQSRFKSANLRLLSLASICHVPLMLIAACYPPYCEDDEYGHHPQEDSWSNTEMSLLSAI